MLFDAGRNGPVGLHLCSYCLAAGGSAMAVRLLPIPPRGGLFRRDLLRSHGVAIRP